MITNRGNTIAIASPIPAPTMNFQESFGLSGFFLGFRSLGRESTISHSGSSFLLIRIDNVAREIGIGRLQAKVNWQKSSGNRFVEYCELADCTFVVPANSLASPHLV